MMEYSYYYPRAPWKERKKQLAQIVYHLQDYDACLNNWNYRQASVRRLNEKLKAPIPVSGHFSFGRVNEDVSLCTPGKIREILSDIDFGLGLDICRHKNFPVYFLFKYKSESFNQHHILLEEIFRSTRYPIKDQRFIRLKAGYSEKVFLNAIPYRKWVATKIKQKRKTKRSTRQINNHLNRIAKVLNLAWEEDNDLTHQVCEQFEMGSVSAAMEVTNLILCTESFSWLRDQVPQVQDFFDERYEHKFLSLQLQNIYEMTEADWRGRVEQAKRDYVQLRRSIVGLYRTLVVRANDGKELPFWKMAFAHYDQTIPALENTDAWLLARKQLIRKADAILDSLQVGPAERKE